MKLFKWIIITVTTLKAKSILQLESGYGLRPQDREPGSKGQDFWGVYHHQAAV